MPWPDSKLMHDSSEEHEEFFFRQRLPKTRSLSNSKCDDPLIIDEPSIGINETVRVEDFRILEMFWVIQRVPKAWHHCCALRNGVTACENKLLATQIKEENPNYKNYHFNCLMNFSYKLGGLKGSSFRFAFANILSSFTFDENLLNFQVSLQKVQPRKLCINKNNWITQIQAFVYKNGNTNQRRS